MFLLCVFFFFIVSFFVPDKTFSYNENRNLAQKPELSLESIFDGSFMEDYESYVTDQIFGRDTFVTFSTNIKLLLGQKEINGVYFSDNYFVEKFQESDIDRELLSKTLDFVKTFMSNHPNAKLGIIPTSGGVVDGLYPKYSTNVNQEELINEIYNYVGSNTIDIYNNLKAHQNEDIYFRTDHHWTALGAYYGYEAVTKAFDNIPINIKEYTQEVIDPLFYGTIQSKVNYDIGPDIIHKYTPNFKTSYTMILNEDKRTTMDNLYDESKLLSKEKYAVYLGGNNGATRLINNMVTNGKKLLVIKDSFSHALMPFLINDYSEILLLDLRHYMGGVETWMKNEKFDEILILFNLKNFVDDRNLIRLNK